MQRKPWKQKYGCNELIYKINQKHTKEIVKTKYGCNELIHKINQKHTKEIAAK
jgi:hypothetical protein